jgi:lipopolysaccharide export system permease protein
MTVISYFLYKIPPLFNITLPISMLVAVLFTIGMLSKNSELTAMRAGGLKLFWIARPIFGIAIFMSLFSIFLNELIVPHCMRRAREIYNIDIRAKDKTGDFNQENIWWRSGSTFYSSEMFDSRNNHLLNLIRLDVDYDFDIRKRTDSLQTSWASSLFGWSMENVEIINFDKDVIAERNKLPTLTLPIQEKPEDFYGTEADPQTMSYQQLTRYINKQKSNGLSANRYYADLYAKISYPFVIFICTLVVLPFAIKPARSGSLAISFTAGIVIAFTYYLVHSFSLAMGRAEFWNPWLAAWMANVIMGAVGLVLNVGAEAPE